MTPKRWPVCSQAMGKRIFLERGGYFPVDYILNNWDKVVLRKMLSEE